MNYLLPAFSGSNLYGSPSVADINQRPYSRTSYAPAEAIRFRGIRRRVMTSVEMPVGASAKTKVFRPGSASSDLMRRCC
jgi:hypothetical protein